MCLCSYGFPWYLRFLVSRVPLVSGFPPVFTVTFPLGFTVLSFLVFAVTPRLVFLAPRPCGCSPGWLDLAVLAGARVPWRRPGGFVPGPFVWARPCGACGRSCPLAPPGWFRAGSLRVGSTLWPSNSCSSRQGLVGWSTSRVRAGSTSMQLAGSSCSRGAARPRAAAGGSTSRALVVQGVVTGGCPSVGRHRSSVGC